MQTKVKYIELNLRFGVGVVVVASVDEKIQDFWFFSKVMLKYEMCAVKFDIRFFFQRMEEYFTWPFHRCDEFCMRFLSLIHISLTPFLLTPNRRR